MLYSGIKYRLRKNSMVKFHSPESSVSIVSIESDKKSKLDLS